MYAGVFMYEMKWKHKEDPRKHTSSQSGASTRIQGPINTRVNYLNFAWITRNCHKGPQGNDPDKGGDERWCPRVGRTTSLSELPMAPLISSLHMSIAAAVLRLVTHVPSWIIGQNRPLQAYKYKRRVSIQDTPTHTQHTSHFNIWAQGSILET